MAPGPAGAPSYVCFIAGSSFAHGFHASDLWKSFTCAKTAGAGAEMVAVRATRYSDGRVATMARNTTTTTASAMRIFMSIVTLLLMEISWPAGAPTGETSRDTALAASGHRRRTPRGAPRPGPSAPPRPYRPPP